MTSEGDQGKCGYVDVKQPSSIKGRKLKVWRRRWVSLHLLTDLTSGDRAARLDVYADQDTARMTPYNRVTSLLLDPGTEAEPCASRTRKHAFQLSMREPLLVLGAETEKELYDWLWAVRSLLRPQTSPDGGRFLVTVQPNASARAVGLQGAFTLAVTARHVQLERQGGQAVQAWGLGSLKKFFLDLEATSHQRRVLVIESGPASPTGEGVFRFLSGEAPQILATIRRCIHLAMRMREERRKLELASAPGKSRAESVSISVKELKAVLDRSTHAHEDPPASPSLPLPVPPETTTQRRTASLRSQTSLTRSSPPPSPDLASSPLPPSPLPPSPLPPSPLSSSPASSIPLPPSPLSLPPTSFSPLTHSPILSSHQPHTPVPPSPLLSPPVTPSSFPSFPLATKPFGSVSSLPSSSNPHVRLPRISSEPSMALGGGGVEGAEGGNSPGPGDEALYSHIDDPLDDVSRARASSAHSTAGSVTSRDSGFQVSDLQDTLRTGSTSAGEDDVIRRDGGAESQSEPWAAEEPARRGVGGEERRGASNSFDSAFSSSSSQDPRRQPPDPEPPLAQLPEWAPAPPSQGDIYQVIEDVLVKAEEDDAQRPRPEARDPEYEELRPLKAREEKGRERGGSGGRGEDIPPELPERPPTLRVPPTPPSSSLPSRPATSTPAQGGGAVLVGGDEEGSATPEDKSSHHYVSIPEIGEKVQEEKRRRSSDVTRPGTRRTSAGSRQGATDSPLLPPRNRKSSAPSDCTATHATPPEVTSAPPSNPLIDFFFDDDFLERNQGRPPALTPRGQLLDLSPPATPSPSPATPGPPADILTASDLPLEGGVGTASRSQPLSPEELASARMPMLQAPPCSSTPLAPSYLGVPGPLSSPATVLSSPWGTWTPNPSEVWAALHVACPSPASPATSPPSGVPAWPRQGTWPGPPPLASASPPDPWLSPSDVTTPSDEAFPVCWPTLEARGVVDSAPWLASDTPSLAPTPAPLLTPGPPSGAWPATPSAWPGCGGEGSGQGGLRAGQGGMSTVQGGLSVRRGIPELADTREVTSPKVSTFPGSAAPLESQFGDDEYMDMNKVGRRLPPQESRGDLWEDTSVVYVSPDVVSGVTDCPDE